MNKKNPVAKNLGILFVLSIILVSFADIMPFSSKVEIQMDKSCAAIESVSWQEGQSLERDTLNRLNCLPESNKEVFNLFILGIMNIDNLAMWVLGVDRRFVVLKMMHEKRLMQASDIADSTERSLQNISYAMRELEEYGLIKCITPYKHTWKKFILTEKGTEVFEKLKENHLIN